MLVNKKYSLIILAVLAVIGSFLAFYSTNLVMNAISNKDTAGFFLELLMPFSALIIAIDFVVASFFFVRLYLHPTHARRMMFVYSITLISLSVLGILFDILSGVLVYRSFVKPYPFAGAPIIFLLWHLAVIALGLVTIFYFKDKTEYDDIFIHKTTPQYVLLTALFSLIVFFAFNRFGAFLWSPSYIQMRTLYNTYPFYMSLILPLGIIVIDVLYIFNIFNSPNKANAGIAIASGTGVLSLFFMIQFISRSMRDQAFLAAISPAVPIERLLTIPIDTILSTVVVVGLTALTFVYSFKFKKLKDKELLLYKNLKTVKAEESTPSKEETKEPAKIVKNKTIKAKRSKKK